MGITVEPFSDTAVGFMPPQIPQNFLARSALAPGGLQTGAQAD